MIDTIKYYLEQAGMKVQTKLLEGDLLELIYKSRDYDLCYAGLGATVPEEIYSFFTSSSMGTMIHGTDTKWDTLYESLTKSRTDAERITAMKALQVYEQETTLQLPMFTLRSVYYTNSKNVELPANFKFGEDRINFDRILSGWKLK
jgi:peptide/nickel transport system substrate-binding protein